MLRKIVSYSLARPARESLFTVVSRAEKYTAKIFMDTVVQARRASPQRVADLHRHGFVGSIDQLWAVSTASALCLPASLPAAAGGHLCGGGLPGVGARLGIRPLGRGSGVRTGVPGMGGGGLPAGAATAAPDSRQQHCDLNSA